jgi:hypothetical protein
MPISHNIVDRSRFNENAVLPYELRLQDFEIAMQDVYDFFYDVNSYLIQKGLQRLDDMLRRQTMSGLLSDMLSASVAKHSRSLTENRFFNGHPDLIVRGVYPNDSVKAGTQGVEIKSTLKRGGAVDTHGARDQWMSVFVYEVDRQTEPAVDRAPMAFTEVYIAQVMTEHFRRNPRSELGTRTATLHREGIARLRQNWVYKVSDR